MEWVIVTLLIIVILIINHNFKKITKVITLYGTKLTELQARIAEMEGNPKDYNNGLWKKYPNA